MKPWLRRTAYLLIVLVAAFAAAWLFLQTLSGRAIVAALIEQALSSDDTTATLEGLEGTLPGAPRIGKLTFSDARGPFVVIEDVRLSWRPLAFICGSIRIDDLRISRVSWLRQTTAGRKPSASSPTLPSLAIGKLRIDAAAVAREVAGVAGRFTLDASLDITDADERAALKLDLRETGGAGARAHADLLYDWDDGALNLDAEVEDGAGGVLASLIGLDADMPLSMKLASDGNLENWRASLQASGGDELRATGRSTIVRQGVWRTMVLRIDSQIGALGSQPWRNLVEGVASIDIAAARSDEGAIRVDRLRIASPALRVDGNGLFDPAERSAHGEATVAVAEGKRLAPLIGEHADWDALTLEARLEGAWPTPALVVTANAANVAAHGVKASTLTARLDGTPDRRWDSGGVRVALRARADAAGVTSTGATVGQLLGPALAFSGRATVVDYAELQELRGEVATAAGTISVEGDVRAPRASGVVTVRASDLKRAGLRAGALSGRFEIDAHLDAGKWTVQGAGVAEDVATGGALDGLFAGQQKLALVAHGNAFDSARVSSFDFEGPRAAARASGTVGRDKIDVRARISLPDLAAVAPDHGGHAKADVRVGGTFEAPRVSGNASLANGRLFTRPVGALALILAEADGSGASELKVAGDFDAKPVDGTAKILWKSGMDVAQVTDLRLAFASLALEGAATIAADGRARGTFDVKLGDLADIGAFIDEEIGGAASGRVTFERVGARQDVALALTSSHFRIGDVHFYGLAANGTIADAFAAPSLNATVRAESADLDGFGMQGMNAVGKGPIAALEVSTKARRADTTIEGVATMKLDRPIAIDVRTFTLSRAGKSASLAAPVKIMIGNDRVMIPAARIVAGNGSLSVAGDAGRDTSLDLAADRLPMWVAAFVVEPLPVTGSVTGTAHIAKRGLTTFDVKIADLAPEANPRLVRNLSVAATGKSDASGVDVSLTLSDPRRTSLRASGRIPFSQAAPVAIDVQGTADLALANVYLSVAGDRARGALTMSARVDGTLGAPRIAGNGKIEGGFWRSAEVGFELRDLTAEFVGSERRITVTRLSGKAPNGGTIGGRGEIRLEPANGYPIEINVTAAHAQLVATELTTVVANVDARMAGPLLTSPKISGAVDVGMWEIRLPERLSRPLTPISVTHRNAPTDLATELAAYEKEPDTGLSFGLDVTVSAPRRVFVRGQGIEAEFGGSGKVTGTVDDPIVNGRFDLRRGAVELLGRRVALRRGVVSFVNEVEPTLDVAGEVRRDNLLATIAVKGKASAPVITLSSTPALPESEILARVLFNRPTQQLSGLEAAQLAGAIARWTGLASGPDILDRLRTTLGIDSLGAVTDESGGSAVGAGSYLGSNVYFGYVQGTDTTAGRATVDIDLTDSLKLRGEASPKGDTRVGVVAEWEY